MVEAQINILPEKRCRKSIVGVDVYPRYGTSYTHYTIRESQTLHPEGCEFGTRVVPRITIRPFYGGGFFIPK